MSEISRLIAEANEKKRMREQNTPIKKIVKVGTCYFALITDAKYEEYYGRQRIAVDFKIFNIPEGTLQTYYFFTSGAAMRFYNEVCETLGTDGDIVDLIGRTVNIMLEQEDKYVNIRVVSEASLEDVEDEIGRLKEKAKQEGWRSVPSRKEQAAKIAAELEKDLADLDSQDDFSELDNNIGDIDA